MFDCVVVVFEYVECCEVYEGYEDDVVEELLGLFVGVCV